MKLLQAASRWEGIDLRDVLAQTGTPVLLLSEARLVRNVRDLRSGLESSWPDVSVRYCAKTNPEPRILELLRAEATAVMASHEHEVRLALASGFEAASIAYQRPVLDPAEVARLVDAGVRRFHAFREGDLDILSAVASKSGAELRVSLRVATTHAAVPFLGRSGRRLGFDLSSLDADAIAKARPGIVIDALNTYIGTQQNDPEAFRGELRTLLRAAVALQQRRLAIAEINLGGGVPSGSLARRVSLGRLLGRSDGRPGIDLREYAARLSSIFTEELRNVRGFRPRLALEPGRAIAGNAVILLTRVSAVQDDWRFLDAGRNVLVESPMLFERAIEPLDPRGGTSTVHLSGPTLNTLDVVGYGRRLPPLREGDVLAVGDAGAYCLSRATRYAGLLPAMWTASEEGTLRCIRSADRPGEVSA